MDKILEKAKELRIAIEETSEYKEYIKNKELLEKNKDVIELKHNIANLRAEGKFIEADRLQVFYNNHPLLSFHFAIQDFCSYTSNGGFKIVNLHCFERAHQLIHQLRIELTHTECKFHAYRLNAGEFLDIGHVL